MISVGCKSAAPLTYRSITMQVIKITHDNLMSEEVTCPMVEELAVMVEMSAEQIAVAIKQDLRNASKNVAKLSCGKLRTIVNKRLADSVDYGDAFKTGGLEVEFECLPDLEVEPDISSAGKNKSTATGARSKATGGKFAGAYIITPKGIATLAAVEKSDPGRWEIVQHILAARSTEDFYKLSPAKAVKKVGSMTSAATELNYSVRSGWVQAAPVAE